jgi:hypothetical protein
VTCKEISVPLGWAMTRAEFVAGHAVKSRYVLPIRKDEMAVQADPLWQRVAQMPTSRGGGA